MLLWSKTYCPALLRSCYHAYLSRLFIGIAGLSMIAVVIMQRPREESQQNDAALYDLPQIRYQRTISAVASKTPLILFWNYVYPEKTARALPEEFTSDFLKCSVEDLSPSQRCLFTHKREKIDNASIVNLQYRQWILDDKRDLSFSSLTRHPSQIWVFHIWESPAHTYHWNWNLGTKPSGQLVEMNGFFNWTMTYRLDSTVPFIYGRLVHRSTPDMSRLFDRLSGKTRSAIWMSSHCDTVWGRGNYVSELEMAGLDVEIAGKCNGRKSNLTECKRTEFYSTKSECMQQIGRTYKFYLAFENSLCVDYVTEKFYRAASLDLIPVVMNGADMSRFAPPHSYIDAKDFSSPTELAEFLKKVGSDPKLYNSYFDWKPFYDVDVRWEGLAYTKNICKLCAATHNQLVNPTTSVYADIEKWWVQQGNCVRKVY